MAKNMFVPIPSEKDSGKWCVAKLLFPGNPTQERYESIKGEYLTQADAQTAADQLNRKYAEDEKEIHEM